MERVSCFLVIYYVLVQASASLGADLSKPSVKEADPPRNILLQWNSKTAVEEGIREGRPGDRCIVKGQFNAKGDLFVEEFVPLCKAGSATNPIAGKKDQKTTKTTSSGAEFRLVTLQELAAAGVKEPKKFGESWQDPSGMIWSDVLREEDGFPLPSFWQTAEVACLKLGAQLPSGYVEDQNGRYGYPIEDSDFVRLRKYFGGKPVNGYLSPPDYFTQILPGLTYILDGGDFLHRISFWSSTAHPLDRGLVMVFSPKSGALIPANTKLAPRHLRCVVRAACRK